ncbi:MAG: hypothetical protein HN509_08430 [Halobacteriovoraceae bacterium]|nr:hypothetical protein [Halobacteriovoraceae bacterium]
MKNILSLAFLMTFSLNTLGATWNLQITDANFDLTQTELPETEFKPFISKTSWRCWFGATESRGEVLRKKIRCNYSIQKTGEFITWVSCSKGRPLGEASFELNDERKNLQLKILATCQF